MPAIHGLHLLGSSICLLPERTIERLYSPISYPDLRRNGSLRKPTSPLGGVQLELPLLPLRGCGQTVPRQPDPVSERRVEQYLRIQLMLADGRRVADKEHRTILAACKRG